MFDCSRRDFAKILTAAGVVAAPVAAAGTMPTRRLGKINFHAGILGLGSQHLGDDTSDQKTADRVIGEALENGLNYIDTAPPYNLSEERVGRALKGKRDKVVIATKFGILRDPNDPTKRGISGKPDYVKKSVEGSLRRLGVDTIDLYYQHRVDRNTPIEETVGAMADLVKAGSIRYIGLSEASPETLTRAHKVHPITALQSEYSLWTRDPEANVLDTCRRLGVGFVAYSPLGRGFLTGAFTKPEDVAEDDFRRNTPRFQGENFRRNFQLVSKVRELAKRIGCTPGQLALAWVLAQGNDIVPIPGTKHRKYLEENVGAADLRLTRDDVATLDAALAPERVSGPRYAPAQQAQIDR